MNKRLALLLPLTLLIFSSCGETSVSSSSSLDTSTSAPTSVPTSEPTSKSTSEPTSVSTSEPTSVPTSEPTSVPTSAPTSGSASIPTTSYEPFSTSITHEEGPGIYYFRYDDGSHIGPTYKIESEYVFKHSFFSLPSNVFSKEFALASLGMAFVANTKTQIKQAYDALEFDDQYYPDYYSQETEIDKAAYSFAHKNIDGDDVIALVPRGSNYIKEWYDNFYLGREGNHVGFNLRANEIYDAFKDYLKDKDYQNIKLWVAGYSRGAALANILAHLIMSKDEIKYKDLYAYTFETPNGLALANAPKYENVFNVFNSGELITYLAPNEMGLTRCGVEVDIYNSHLDELITYFDPEAELPKFTKGDKYQNETEYCQYIIESLMNVTFSNGHKMSREELCDQYVNNTQYVMPLLFKLTNNQQYALLNDIMKIDNVMMKLVIGNFTDVENAIFKCFDDNGIEYDKDVLKEELDNLFLTIQKVAMPLVTEYMSHKDNLMRIIYAHDQKAVYCTLMGYVI